MLRIRIAAVVLVASLLGVAVVGAVAQQGTPVATDDVTAEATQEDGTAQQQTVQQEPIVQEGGAEGLVAAVIQIADVIDITDSNIEIVTIQVEDSLNNLRALNNVLNESPILSDNNIVITDVIEIGTIDAVVAIGVLDGGDLIIFSQDSQENQD